MPDEKIVLYSVDESSEASHRKTAVEAALELIRSAAIGGDLDLVGEISRLSQYADQIQEALRPQKT